MSKPLKPDEEEERYPDGCFFIDKHPFLYGGPTGYACLLYHRQLVFKEIKQLV